MVRGAVYPPPALLLCPSTILYLGPSTAVSKHQTIYGTQHERASSSGGVRGGGYPPRHGCCVQAPDYIWDPARGGMLEGGGLGAGLPSLGTAAVSKHQTISGTLKITLNIAAGLSGQKFETSKVCIYTQNHPSAKKSSFFVPWEAGGSSPS